MAWLNNDGLYIKFGPEEGHSISDAGSYAHVGPTQFVEMELNLVDLTEVEAVQNDVLVLPRGAQIESVELSVTEIAATGAAFDLGLIAATRVGTDVTYLSVQADPDALIATQATADIDAVGDNVLYKVGVEIPTQGGSGAAGAAIGQILVNPCLITCSRTTGTAFTTGKLRVRITYKDNAAAANEFALG